MSQYRPVLIASPVLPSYMTNGNAAPAVSWTRDTYALRFLLFGQHVFTSSEQTYLDSRWGIYDKLLRSESAPEFILNLTIMQSSMKFVLLDYFTLLLGFGAANPQGLMFDPHVVFELIDTTEFLDECLKQPWTSRQLLKFKDEQQIIVSGYVKQLLAHIYTKFPSLMKMSFNFGKSSSALKKHRRFCRFGEAEVKKYYKAFF